MKLILLLSRHMANAIILFIKSGSEASTIKLAKAQAMKDVCSAMIHYKGGTGALAPLKF